MSETVYIETSILGYLTARPSRNLILVANAEVTREWWDTRRNNFDLYTSQAVLKEVAQGDAEIAAQRLEREHVNFVGWVEARNPTLAGLLGFTYVQPNLLEELIAKLTCTP